MLSTRWYHLLLFLFVSCWIGNAAASENPWLVDLPTLEFRLHQEHHSNRKIALLEKAAVHGLHAVPLLAIAAEDNDILVRRAAIKVLSKLGPLAKSAEPQLLAQLNSEDAPLRAHAMLALVRINGLGVDAVVNALRSNVPAIRRAADVALRDKFGFQLREHFPAWLRALSECEQLGIVPKLNTLLLHANKVVTVTAAQWLGEFDDLAKPSLVNLIQLLRRDDATLNAQAAAGIGRIGRLAHVAKEDLLMLLRKPSPLVRVSAAIALDAIGYADLAQEALILELQSGDMQRIPLALQSMRGLRSLSPALRRMLETVLREHTDSAVVSGIAKLADTFVLSDAGLVEQLYKVVSVATREPEVRFTALSALSAMGENNERLIAVLKQLPPWRSLRDHVASLEVYGRLSSGELRPIVTSLLPFLHSTSPAVRDPALDVFDSFAPQAEYAMPFVIKRMVDLRIESEQDRRFYLRLADVIRRVQEAQVKKDSA